MKEAIKCSICFELLCDPKLHIQCGHMFCHKCLYNWQQQLQLKEMTCPICRQFEPFSFVEAPKTIKHMLEQLPQRCSVCNFNLPQHCIVSHLLSHTLDTNSDFAASDRSDRSSIATTVSTSSPSTNGSISGRQSDIESISLSPITPITNQSRQVFLTRKKMRKELIENLELCYTKIKHFFHPGQLLEPNNKPCGWYIGCPSLRIEYESNFERKSIDLLELLRFST